VTLFTQAAALADELLAPHGGLHHQGRWIPSEVDVRAAEFIRQIAALSTRDTVEAAMIADLLARCKALVDESKAAASYLECRGPVECNPKEVFLRTEALLRDVIAWMERPADEQVKRSLDWLRLNDRALPGPPQSWFGEAADLIERQRLQLAEAEWKLREAEEWRALQARTAK